MGFLDGVWHLLNFFAPAVGLGAVAALLAKLAWWRELKGVGWPRLAAWASTCAAIALVAGLLWSGHDGRVSTYAAMVLSCSLGLWWAGWIRPGR